MAPSIRDAALAPESDPIDVDLSPVAGQLIENVEMFPFNNSVGCLAGLVPPTTDTISWFAHSDGKRYGVVHTLFGNDPASIYEKKIRQSSWTASLGGTAHKRQPIKDYISRNSLCQDQVYCIMETYDDN